MGGLFFFFSSLIFVAKISVKRGPDIPDPSIPGCSYLERPTKLLSFKVQHVPSEGSVLKFVPKMASMIAIPLKGTTWNHLLGWQLHEEYVGMLGLSSTTLSSKIHFMLVHFCSTFGRVMSHPSLLYTHFTIYQGIVGCTPTNVPLWEIPKKRPI